LADNRKLEIKVYTQGEEWLVEFPKHKLPQRYTSRKTALDSAKKIGRAIGSKIIIYEHDEADFVVYEPGAY